MQTAVIQIGNTDDKLSQKRWSEFVAATATMLDRYRYVIHFAGYSAPGAPWQNACWVFEVDESWEARLREDLAQLAGSFDQDSIALTLGPTEFVPGAGR